MGTDAVRSLLIAILIALSGATAAEAGPFEDAAAAYTAGDHAKAAQLFRPMAEQGDARAQNNLGRYVRQQRWRATGLSGGN